MEAIPASMNWKATYSAVDDMANIVPRKASRMRCPRFTVKGCFFTIMKMANMATASA